MSDLHSQILAALEREDPDEADAFRESIQEAEDIISDFEREFEFEFDGSQKKNEKK
jgi:hypothetical protein